MGAGSGISGKRALSSLRVCSTVRNILPPQDGLILRPSHAVPDGRRAASEMSDNVQLFPWETKDGLWAESGLSFPGDEWTRGGAALAVESKRNIVHMYVNEDVSPEDIARLIRSPRGPGHIHVRTVRRVLEQWARNGHVEDGLRKQRETKMEFAHVELLVEIALENPWQYLDEIALALQARSGTSYHPRLCWVELRRRDLTLKKMRERAAQRDEYQRLLYFEAVGAICTHPSQLTFADETAYDERTLRRKRGWGFRGARCEVTAPLVHGKHLSVLALYGYHGFIDFSLRDGGFNAEDFMWAAEHMIIPHLQPYPQPNSILVLDNCRIHHTHEDALRAMVNAVGAKLLFLAPYSPIDSPIECGFNCFKATWRRHEEYLSDFEDHDAIRYCLMNCYSGFAGKCAQATYEECGYFP